MKNVFKVGIGAIASVLIVVLLAAGYWAIAPTLIGPKTAVSNLCSLAKVGMPLAEFSAVLEQNKSFNTMPVNTEGVQYISEIKRGWMCTCGIQIENERIADINETVCID